MQEFEYDLAKSRSNRHKHGISFKQAELIWGSGHPLLIEEDDRYFYGEQRFKATGLLPNLLCIVVIYTERDAIIRMISARQANSWEREYYYDESGYTQGI